ncbi:MAG: GNAT family N-acetyltransferase [Anaerolineaceae bacterium]|nr:GNAT family N-acetyltransferase [Anaerolineaceae bacterium]
MNPFNPVKEYQEGEFIFSSDPARLDLVFTHNWLANKAYWSQGLPYKVFKRMVNHSLCFGVYHQSGKQVGFGRVITDYTTFAWLTDVFIIDEYRGKGLSVTLINFILEHPELMILRRWMLGTDHAHGLYRKFGFGGLDHPENFLTRHHRQMYVSGEYNKLITEFFKKRE